MLWIFLAIPLFCATTGALPALEKEVEPYALEDTIKKAIEGVRNVIPESINVPLTDIFKDPLPINFTFIAQGNVSLKHVNVTGLKNFDLVLGTMQMVGMRLNITLNFKNLKVNLGYGTDVLLLDLFPLYGTGDLWVPLEDLKVAISTQFNFNEAGVPQLKGLILALNLGDFSVGITGLLNDKKFSETVTTVLNFLLPKKLILEAISQPIDPNIVEGIQELINLAIPILWKPKNSTSTPYETWKEN